jgi:ribosomal protein L28
MRHCENCKRGFLSTVSRSHSNIATKRRQNVNLQARTVDGVRMLLCASCIKATKHKAEKKLAAAAK